MIKITCILFVFFLIFLSCASKEKKFSLEEAILALPENELPSLLRNLKNGDSNGIKIDSAYHGEFLTYSAIINLKESKVYAVLHTNAETKSKYITLVNHEVFDSLICCSETSISTYEIKVFELEDTSIYNITNVAFPTITSDDRKLNLSRNSTSCYSIYPSVDKDQIALCLYDKIIKYDWQDFRYEYTTPYSNEWEYLKCALPPKEDPDFEKYLEKFYKAIINHETTFIIENTYFPLSIVKEPYPGTNEKETVDYIEKNDKSKVLTYFYDTSFEYYLKADRSISYYEISFSNKIGKDSIICNESLSYTGRAFHIGGAMMNCIFTKTCKGYKLSSFNITHAAGSGD